MHNVRGYIGFVQSKYIITRSRRPSKAIIVFFSFEAAFSKFLWSLKISYFELLSNSNFATSYVFLLNKLVVLSLIYTNK